MNILDVEENEVDVIIVVRQLEPLPHGHVSHRILARPRIKYDRDVHFLQVVLIFSTPCSCDTNERLYKRRSTEGGVEWYVAREDEYNG